MCLSFVQIKFMSTFPKLLPIPAHCYYGCQGGVWSSDNFFSFFLMTFVPEVESSPPKAYPTSSSFRKLSCMWYGILHLKWLS